MVNQIKDHEAPNIVSIGEDATRVIGRIDYDSETDRCVGFVLPLNKDGLPIVDAFLATSFTAIESMFQRESISKYAYLYMAQPLKQDAPPFCLACIGTNNKFTAKHIIQRWKYIYSECAKRGITVLSFGGDGDSRIMKAMRVSTTLHGSKMDHTIEQLIQELPSYSYSLEVPESWGSWFFIKPKIVSYVQDTVHLAVKLKSRLLNPKVILKMGPVFEASAYHIEMLRGRYGKDQHFLREKDVNHKDRQNYDAVLHIINAAHLLAKIDGAGATKCYIELIQNIIDSYLDKSLDPLVRVEKMWYSTFVIRYWRQWILLHPHYTLRANFITHNCYQCVELNAHALITYILAIKNHFEGDSIYCLPWLLGSQTCERTFRTVRSMSTVFSSVLNFTLLGLLRRLHRLNIQLSLQATSGDKIKFLNTDRHGAKEGKNLQSNKTPFNIQPKDITESIETANKRAKKTLEMLGMDKLLKANSVWDKEFVLPEMNDADDGANEDNDDNDDNEDDDDDKVHEKDDSECAGDDSFNYL